MISLEPCNPPAADSVEPSVLDMRCISAAPSTAVTWHSHAFFELVLLSQDGARLGCGTITREVVPDTLMLCHAGESHACWTGGRQKPRFWLLHFTLPTEALVHFPRFTAGNPERRLWKLRPKEAEAFRRMFLQMLNERMRPQELQAQAEAAWLRLLLISVHRWAVENSAEAPPGLINTELVNLWHLVNASVGQPPEYLERIHTYPNYDSLRHGFKRAFGCSPRAMVMRLRIQHAKNLLLESNLSIKEIAARCGYQRQHEFARAFRQQAGHSPTEWRSNPAGLAASIEFAAPDEKVAGLRQTA